MEYCFVIQPFDKGMFDKRYDDVIAPAIQAAGLEPYRVDKDPKVEIPIEEIENGIRKARICLAEITTNNPNVWYELGYALACGKSVVFICADDREGRFPFDVQHRTILTYKTESSSDFNHIKDRISERIKALLEKEDGFKEMTESSPIAQTEGLSEHEIVALASVMKNQISPGDTVYSHNIKSDMNRAGYTDIATSLAIRSLARKKLISIYDAQDINGNNYSTFMVTSEGESWLQENISRLVIKQKIIEETSDGDIPF